MPNSTHSEGHISILILAQEGHRVVKWLLELKPAIKCLSGHGASHRMANRTQVLFSLLSTTNWLHYSN